jgi:hypothetical protein
MAPGVVAASSTAARMLAHVVGIHREARQRSRAARDACAFAACARSRRRSRRRSRAHVRMADPMPP